MCDWPKSRDTCLFTERMSQTNGPLPTYGYYCKMPKKIILTLEFIYNILAVYPIFVSSENKLQKV